MLAWWALQISLSPELKSLIFLFWLLTVAATVFPLRTHFQTDDFPILPEENWAVASASSLYL